MMPATEESLFEDSVVAGWLGLRASVSLWRRTAESRVEMMGAYEGETVEN